LALIKKGIAVPRITVVAITIKSVELIIIYNPYSISLSSNFEISAKATEPRIIPANEIMKISYLFKTHFSYPLILFHK